MAEDIPAASKRSVKKLGDLDGSLHISTHGKINGGAAAAAAAAAAVSTSVHVSSAVAADEGDANSVTEGSDDFAHLDDDDDKDSGSFCDADETCSADQGFLRRGMSVGPDELEDFVVEFGDEIKNAPAYYGDDDGVKIEVPVELIPVDKLPKDEMDQGKEEEDEDIKEAEEILEKMGAGEIDAPKEAQDA